MSLDIGADGPNTSPGIGPVDLVQVGKAAFVKSKLCQPAGF